MKVDDRVTDGEGEGTITEVYRGPHEAMQGMVKVTWDNDGGWTWEPPFDLQKLASPANQE